MAPMTSNLGTAQQMAKQWFDELMDSIESAVTDGVKAGQSTMIRMQRVDTGLMRVEVDSSVERKPTEVTGKIGWITDQEDYFYYQEAGFRHVGGQWIEGMHSLRAAGDEAIAVAMDKLGQ